MRFYYQRALTLGAIMAEVKALKANCRRCGDVIVPTSDVRVTAAAFGTGLFVFDCPICGCEVWQASDTGTLLMLRSAGATSLEGATPLELTELHDGLPISWDDLLDAHEVMRDHCCPQDELTA
jgi:hypothetical protein